MKRSEMTYLAARQSTSKSCHCLPDSYESRHFVDEEMGLQVCMQFLIKRIRRVFVTKKKKGLKISE